MKNFWKTLQRPVMCLAPMADVTDAPFRNVIARYGKPDVFWTEFVSADGLYHTREIQKMKDSENPLMRDLLFTKKEHPIVAQIFTSNPDMMEYASALIVKLGFDVVDINMGCPHKAIEKQGAGAFLIKKPAIAVELIKAAKRGVKGKIPISVKTRIGYNKNQLEVWLPVLLREEPKAITVHARTRREMSAVPAKWEYIKRAVEIRNEVTGSDDILIIGNGDITSVDEAHTKAFETGADGVMIGRGIFGNPWLFSGKIPTEEEKLQTLLEHCKLFDTYCTHKSFAVMKKHFKAYVSGFHDAKELRVALFACNTTHAVKNVIEKYLKNKV
jgi:nifR3 family TIM-barrel protein